ncbi:MAG TPA: hypothetical protein VMT20_27330 [Terriglobia bacterium]|nr:hypothetical protein [Terriglobia bacterium]
MKHNYGSALLGAGIIALFAGSLGLAKTTAKTIQILYPAQISDGTVLKPGTYRVALNTASQNPTLDFSQNGRQVAQTPVKLVSEQAKNTQTQVLYNTGGKTDVITEIDFNGSNQRMLLGHTSHP